MFVVIWTNYFVKRISSLINYLWNISWEINCLFKLSSVLHNRRATFDVDMEVISRLHIKAAPFQLPRWKSTKNRTIRIKVTIKVPTAILLWAVSIPIFLSDKDAEIVFASSEFDFSAENFDYRLDLLTIRIFFRSFIHLHSNHTSPHTKYILPWPITGNISNVHHSSHCLPFSTFKVFVPKLDHPLAKVGKLSLQQTSKNI